MLENLILSSVWPIQKGAYFVPMGVGGLKPWFPWPHYNPPLTKIQQSSPAIVAPFQLMTP